MEIMSLEAVTQNTAVQGSTDDDQRQKFVC
jgi:hypothetical protein